MFDLITGKSSHMPRHQGVPIVISTTVQVIVAVLVLAIPYLYMTAQLPETPSMMAFVAAPPPPPPPPPPPAPAPKAAVKPAAVAPKPGQFVAPLEAPPSVEPEAVATTGEEGVFGGVEGGVPGGVLGGIVGGIPELVPPPPPPAPPPPVHGPVAIGGQLKAPELIRRVEPEYPSLAKSAHYEGMVILEATVNEDGQVEDVRVLRSGGLAGVLDRAAIAAVRQWQYTPLQLNGRRERFVLSVMLSFNLQR